MADFFVQTENGYKQSRIDMEIKDYHGQSAKNKTNGMLGGRPKKTQSVILANPDESQINPNQKPITINHKPIKERTATRGTRLPADWKPNAELAAWSKAERPDLELRKVFEEFKDYWSSVAGSGGVKLNWDATWRNWVRKQTAAKASFAQQASDVVRSTVPYSQDKSLRKVEEDHKTGAPPPAHIREMMRGILGVKNA